MTPTLTVTELLALEKSNGPTQPGTLHEVGRGRHGNARTTETIHLQNRHLSLDHCPGTLLVRGLWVGMPPPSASQLSRSWKPGIQEPRASPSVPDKVMAKRSGRVHGRRECGDQKYTRTQGLLPNAPEPWSYLGNGQKWGKETKSTLSTSAIVSYRDRPHYGTRPRFLTCMVPHSEQQTGGHYS